MSIILALLCDELKVDYESIEQSEPSFAKSAPKLMEQGWNVYLFDVEQVSMLMQSIVEEIEKGRGITVLANTPVDIVSGIFRGGMSLPSFMKKVVPHSLRGSKLHIHVKGIAKEYFEKSQKHGPPG